MLPSSKLKTKLARKIIFRKIQPSNKDMDQEQQQNLERNACEKLKEESFLGFDSIENEQQNPFLRRKIKLEKIQTQCRARNNQRVSPSTSLSKCQIKSTNHTLSLVQSQTKRINKFVKSTQASPRKMLPLNLTQYIIVDSDTVEETSPIKFSTHTLQQKYMKALAQINKKREASMLMNKSKVNYNSFSQSANLHKNKFLKFK